MSERFAVISDIHGNLEGLQAVLARVKRLRIKEIICLGDVVGYGADPKTCWAMVKRVCSIVLEGNHEAILLDRSDDTQCSSLGRQSALWTRSHVSVDMRKELEKLPFKAERLGASFFHSTPRNDGTWPYLNYPTQVANAFSNEKSPLIFYGHTHRPRITVLDSAGSIIHDELIQKTSQYMIDLRQYRCYVNPGSTGQQRDSHTDASFAVYELDGDIVRLQVIRLAYRRFRTYCKLLDSGYGRQAAEYLIREKKRRDAFELLDYWRHRVCRNLSDR